MFLRQSFLCLFTVLILLISVIQVCGLPWYRYNIPHGFNVTFFGIWRGVGHYSRNGGGPRNPFGVDFAAENHTWTLDLCLKDSDGDGISNGVELGDPDCVFIANSTAFNSSELVDSPITHPGLKQNATLNSFGVEGQSATIGNGAFTVSWIYDSKEISFDITANTGGWIGFGVSRAGYMVGSDVVIAKPWTNTAVDSYIGDKAAELITDDANQNITNVQYSITDGVTTLRFTRPLAASESTDLAINRTFYAIWATSDSSTYTVLTHHNLRGALRINLETGAVEEVKIKNKPWEITHGVLMFISWGFMSPLAGIFARYFRNASFNMWFRAHWMLQSSMFLLVIAGFFTSVASTASLFGGTPHHYLGIITMLITIWQISSGVGRPHSTSKGLEHLSPEDKSRRLNKKKRWEQTHRYSGRLLLVVSNVTLFTGIWILNDRDTFLYIYIAYACSLVVLCSILELWLMQSGKRNVRLQRSGVASMSQGQDLKSS